MRSILFTLATTLALSSCSSCKDNNNNATPANTWKIGSTTYTAATIERVSITGDFTISASTSGANRNNIGFTFLGVPAAGTYKVSVSGASVPKQVEITTSYYDANGNLKVYQCTGSDNAMAAVSVNNGKISITLPDAIAKSFTGSDSLKVSANNITEQ